MDRDVDYAIAQPAQHPSPETWEAESTALADDKTPLPYEFTAVLVRASPQCDAVLREHVVAADYLLPSLPAGCHEIAEQNVTVTVR